MGNQRKWENYPNGRSGGVVSDVRYFVFSSRRCSSSVFSAAPHLSSPSSTPRLPQHHISPSASGRQLQPQPLSLAPCLENKLIFTPNPLRRHCWLARFVSIDCSICVADLSFFSPPSFPPSIATLLGRSLPFTLNATWRYRKPEIHTRRNLIMCSATSR